MTRCYVHPIPDPRPTRPGAFPAPWIILSSEAGDWQRACHLDDADVRRAMAGETREEPPDGR